MKALTVILGWALASPLFGSAPIAGADAEEYSFGMISDTHYSRPEHYAEGESARKAEYAAGWMTHERANLARAAAICAAEPKAAFYVHTGDMVDGRCGSLERQRAQLAEMWELTRGAFPADVPFLVANGNHETYDFEAPGTYAYPAYEQTVQRYLAKELARPEPIERHYSYRHGRDLFIFYNSNVDEYDFVKATLEANPDARWVFLVGHIPAINPCEYGIEIDSPWAGNFMENHNRFLRLLQSRQVILLCGDTHRLGLVDYVTAEGRLTELMGVSVYMNGPYRELGTTPADFPGNWSAPHTPGGIISERQRFLKSGLVRNWLAAGAGFWKLHVSATQVTADLYTWDREEVVKTVQLRGPETAVESVALEIHPPLKVGLNRIPVRLSKQLAEAKLRWYLALPSGWSASTCKPQQGYVEVVVPPAGVNRREEVAIKLYAQNAQGRIVAQDDHHFLQQQPVPLRATEEGLVIGDLTKAFRLQSLNEFELASVAPGFADEKKLWSRGNLLEVFVDLKGTRSVHRTGDHVQVVIAAKDDGKYRALVIRDAGKRTGWVDLDSPSVLPWSLIAPSSDPGFRPRPGDRIGIDLAYGDIPLLGSAKKHHDDPSLWAYGVIIK